MHSAKYRHLRQAKLRLGIGFDGDKYFSKVAILHYCIAYTALHHICVHSAIIWSVTSYFRLADWQGRPIGRILGRTHRKCVKGENIPRDIHDVIGLSVFIRRLRHYFVVVGRWGGQPLGNAENRRILPYYKFRTMP